jgi:hypothetical protein
MPGYDEAVEIQRRHEDELMGTPGVTGVGAALVEGRIVLRVFVDPGAAPPALPDEVEGLPVVVVRTTIEPLSD